MNQDSLKAIIHYNSESGVFIWKISSGSVKKGKEAGKIFINRSVKYRVIRINKKTYYAHRLAWMYMNGKWPNGEIDHIDGNGLNNEIKNLREVTKSENQKNLKRNNLNTSGISGVDKIKKSGLWRVRISHENKSIHIGCFSSFFEACCARKSAELKYGYHENHGR